VKSVTVDERLKNAKKVDGIISEMNLSNCDITAIPTNVFYYTKLRTLNLAHNGLEYLPDSINSFPLLEILNLSNNGFKAFPDILGVLKNLTKLNISMVSILVRIFVTFKGDTHFTFYIFY
jgi:Leucine-rich repeat (LRR) protein